MPSDSSDPIELSLVLSPGGTARLTVVFTLNDARLLRDQLDAAIAQREASGAIPAELAVTFKGTDTND